MADARDRDVQGGGIMTQRGHHLLIGAGSTMAYLGAMLWLFSLGLEAVEPFRRELHLFFCAPLVVLGAIIVVIANLLPQTVHVEDLVADDHSPMS
jgi:hypothetical protein